MDIDYTKSILVTNYALWKDQFLSHGFLSTDQRSYEQHHGRVQTLYSIYYQLIFYIFIACNNCIL